MRRTICLVLIFLLAQLLSSMVVMFFFNLPNLLHEGTLDVNVLASSPTALGISLWLNGAVVWAAMTLLRWTDRKSFRAGGYGWPLYGIVVLWMVPIIFIVNLLLETLSLEDLNAEVFSRLVYDPWGVLGIVRTIAVSFPRCSSSQASVLPGAIVTTSWFSCRLPRISSATSS